MLQLLSALNRNRERLVTKWADHAVKDRLPRGGGRAERHGEQDAGRPASAGPHLPILVRGYQKMWFLACQGADHRRIERTPHARFQLRAIHQLTTIEHRPTCAVTEVRLTSG